MKRFDIDQVFIRTQEEFLKYQTIAKQIFNLDQTFPQQVFNENYTDFLFEDFDFIMSVKWWDDVRSFSKETGDEFIIVGVIDPDPETYYFKEFGYYNWLKMPVNVSEDQYYQVLGKGPKDFPADAIEVNSFKVVWFSPTGKWAIFGDREFGVSIIAFRDSDLKSKLISLIKKSWSIFDKEIAELIESNFINKKEFKEELHTLKSNYLKLHSE